MSADLPAGVAAVQRRTVRTLVLAQALGALGITIGIATASLLARDLSGSDQWAGLAQTAQVLGAAAASWLIANLMGRRGRRIGLAAGYVVAALGAGLAVVAGVVESMALLIVGAVLLGASSSANYAARYAATDLAEPEHRGRALSIVVWATTIGAVVGPNLTGPSADLANALSIPELTGAFALGAMGMLAAGIVVWWRLRPDPLLLAREVAARSEGHTPDRPKAPLRSVLAEHPALLPAIIGLAAAHAVMISVMVMTPLHMEHGGATLDVIGFVISLHVLGMFAFSPLVGMASDRFGRVPVLAAGGAVLLVSLILCAVSPEGSSVQIFGGLFLLGLGWSMASVSASTIVAEQAPLSARTQVQGAADLTMGLAGAVGSAASGMIVHHASFALLAGYSSIFAIVVLVAALAAARATRAGELTGSGVSGR